MSSCGSFLPQSSLTTGLSNTHLPCFALVMVLVRNITDLILLMVGNWDILDSPEVSFGECIGRYRFSAPLHLLNGFTTKCSFHKMKTVFHQNSCFQKPEI